VTPNDVSERIPALNFAAEDGLHFDAYVWYFVDVDWLTSGAVGYLPHWAPVVRERYAERPMVAGKPTKACCLVGIACNKRHRSIVQSRSHGLFHELVDRHVHVCRRLPEFLVDAFW
jgi:hypothetical protein